jgi:low temperature requirement protein LtrA
MSAKPKSLEMLHHHARRMIGRDPKEHNRVATSLEALFDLTFATCFGLAAARFAESLAAGHYAAALFGFGFASFAICWAWINFSWFCSAYDTDDWIFRVMTMVQMVGVLVLAIGLPRMFASIERGAPLDDAVMVLGYVVMRVAMVCQWLRAARQDASRRRACLTYATAISLAQIGWVTQIFVEMSAAMTIICTGVLVVVEFVGPVLAERQDGGTPWHAHHIAERYSLFALVAFGEGVVGTVAALSAIVEASGWSLDAAFICLAGVGLTFGMWWVYSLLPSAEILRANRDRSFAWGYGQIVAIAAIVATGAGLHVGAYFVEQKAQIDALAALLCIAIPVAVYLASIYALYYHLARRADRLHAWLLAATAAVMAASVAAVIAGMSLAVGLIILMFAPAVSVLGYELSGYRHQMKLLGEV